MRAYPCRTRTRGTLFVAAGGAEGAADVCAILYRPLEEIACNLRVVARVKLELEAYRTQPSRRKVEGTSVEDAHVYKVYAAWISLQSSTASR